MKILYIILNKSTNSTFTQALLGAHPCGNHESQTSFRASILAKSVIYIVTDSIRDLSLSIDLSDTSV
jgi:hypothetical protein